MQDATETLKRLAADDRGNVAIIAALVMTAIIGCGAMAIDVGSLSHERRALQSAADTAAMAAVIPILQTQAINTSANVTRLTAIVAAAMASNGYSQAVVDSTTPGTYCPDPTLAPTARFTAGQVSCANGGYSGPVPNAVRTTVHVQSPFYLAQFLSRGGTQTIAVTSTAVGMDEAGFTIGTGLIAANTANSALLNGVLGGMLGSSLSLSAVSYDGLTNTQLNALNFLNPIATSSSVNVATISSLSTSSVSLATVFQAEATALSQSGTLTTAGTNALTGLQLLNTAVYGAPTVQMGQLLNAAAWQTTASGGSTSPTALQATVNAFEVASAAIQLANGSHAVTVPTSGLGIPGLSSLTVSANAVAPAQSGYPGGGLGYVGTSASTSQVNLQLGLAATPAPISLGVATAQVSLTLPVTVALANGTAQLTGISCGATPSADSQVTVTGTTSAGTIDVSLSTKVVITALGVQLLNYTAVVPLETQIAATAPTAVTFSQSDIQNKVVKRISSLGVTANTVDPGTMQSSTSTLMTLLATQSNAKISVQVLGLTSPVLTGLLSGLTSSISSLVSTTLTTTLGPALNTALQNVAAALGVQVGYMDIMATGARCGVPAIVN